MMSMKFLVIKRLARRIRSGAGLVGSWRSIHSQTRSSACSASSRVAIEPGAPPRAGVDAATVSPPLAVLSPPAACAARARH